MKIVFLVEIIVNNAIKMGARNALQTKHMLILIIFLIAKFVKRIA